MTQVQKTELAQSTFPAVVIIGPTACGKTAFAHYLSTWLTEKGIGNALLNLDAFQFYNEVSAGTAKPTPEEISAYSYKGIDILPANYQDFDAQSYANYAQNICTEYFKNKLLPICVGGSGLYLRAFLHGLDKLPPKNLALRNFFRERAAILGWPELHKWLKNLDPERASELHPNDSVRIERALEIYIITGEKMSSLSSKTQKLSEQKTLFDSFIVHVNAPDQILQERIAARTQIMLSTNWLTEVETLLKTYGESLKTFNSMRAIGYPEVINYLETSSTDLQALTNKISTLTWQYARRQRTWNAKEKRDYSVEWGNHSVLNCSEHIFNWFAKYLTLCFFICFFVACGNSSSTENNDLFPENINMLSTGLTVVVYPFNTDSQNVYVNIPINYPAFKFASPELIPGVHWQWSSSPPSEAEISKTNYAEKKFVNNWESFSNFPFPREVSEQPPLLFRYKTKLTNPGKGDVNLVVMGAASQDAGILSLNNYLYLLPTNFALPLRVYFYTNSSPLQINSIHKSCGDGCVDFGSYSEALDTPIAISSGNTPYFIRKEGVYTLLTYLLNIEDIPKSIDIQLINLQTTLEKTWRYLTNLWGNVTSENKYQANLIITNSSTCTNTALEHANSALACTSPNSKNNLVTDEILYTLTHEMIHAWNVKAIFPAEHYLPDFSTFTVARIRQEDFYEGFTDGFTRTLLILLDTSVTKRQFILNRWNTSISSIYSSAIGKKHSELDPFMAYKIGSLISLRIAAAAKKQYGVKQGSELFFSIIKNLSNDINIKTKGYTREELLNKISSTLAINNWNIIYTDHFSTEIPFASTNMLADIIKEISTATGIKTLNTNDLFLFDVVNAPEGTDYWPL